MDIGAARYDRWGYPVRTNSDDCIVAINSYYHQILAYGRNRKVIVEATARDPTCVLANVLAAHFLIRRDPSEASKHLAAATSNMVSFCRDTHSTSNMEGATSYEKAVFKAVSTLLVEDVDDDAAFQAHSELLKEYPRDLIGLKRTEQLCFYMGRPDLSWSLVELVLPQNEEENYMYGMVAFPLLELGRMVDAERAAIKALQINRDDFWAQHALCHIYQNDCRFKEAVIFMETCSSTWISCSSLRYSHNWWHTAICYLEGHAPLDKVLKIYDRIMKETERPDADCEDVYLDALGILLRVYVRGKVDCIKDRIKIFASIFKIETNWHVEWLLDLLALWALTIGNENDKAVRLLNSMKFKVYKMSKVKQHSMQKGLLLAEALHEYGKGNSKKVFDLLGPEFDARDCKMIGASDEQLDVFNEVWYIVLMNTGHVSKAIQAIEKRVKEREGAPFLWRLLEGAYSMEHNLAASVASEKAKVLESKYFK